MKPSFSWISISIASLAHSLVNTNIILHLSNILSPLLGCLFPVFQFAVATFTSLSNVIVIN